MDFHVWLGIVALAIWFLIRWLNPKTATTTITKADIGYLADTRRLTAACLGDREKADSLINQEKQRSPCINHAEAVIRALERIEGTFGETEI
jgi:hypothetical protein